MCFALTQSLSQQESIAVIRHRGKKALRAWNCRWRSACLGNPEASDGGRGRGRRGNDFRVAKMSEKGRETREKERSLGDFAFCHPRGISSHSPSRSANKGAEIDLEGQWGGGGATEESTPLDQRDRCVCFH